LLVSRAPVAVAGTATISAPGTFIAATGANATFSGNISASGTLSISGTTMFTGNSTLTGAGLKTLNNIIISGILTPNAIYTVTGDFALTGSGILNPGANTTFFAGVDSHISNSGTGTVTFNDLNVQTGNSLTSFTPLIINGSFGISGNFVSNSGFSALGSVSVAVDTGSCMVNSRPFSIAGTLTVSSGAVMTVNEGADATFFGNISASGALTILSTSLFSGTTVFTGGGTKIFTSVIVTGTLTPNASYSITGDLSITGTGILLEGTSTTTFSGINSAFSNSGNNTAVFHNILISAGAKLTNITELRANGTFRTSGNFVAASDLFVKGTLTISRGGSYWRPIQSWMLVVISRYLERSSRKTLLDFPVQPK
jgi:fibronectin-binding autotransporter adhesin